MTTAGAEEDNKGKNESSSYIDWRWQLANDKKVGDWRWQRHDGVASQEATKLLKSLHLPNVKMITLQEIGDPLKQPYRSDALRQWRNACTEEG